MESFNEITEFFEEIDELGTIDNIVDIDPQVPHRANVYTREITNPLEVYDDEEFRRRYRFTKETVINYIVPLLQNGPRHHTRRGLPITIENQALIALRFYATGCIQVVCADLHFVSQATVSRIVKNVSAKLAGCLPQYVKFPVNLQQVCHQFEALPGNRYPGLKNIIGAIDCTHIKIKRPRGIVHSEAYRNRKGFFSVNVQVVGGPDMRIYDIVTRWPGSAHDSRIFRSSRLHARLESRLMQGVLVGDSGYRATTYMLTPFLSTNTPAEIRYNYVQIRTRNIIERLFGVWKKRFACLQVGLGTKLTTTTNIIAACAVLHNIGIDANDAESEEPADDPTSNVYVAPARSQTPSGLAYRNFIVDRYYNY